MNRRIRLQVSAHWPLALALVLLGIGPFVSPAIPGSERPLGRAFQIVPLNFEKNMGQADPTVRFMVRRPGYTLFLTSTGATLTLRSQEPGSTHSNRMESRVHVQLVHANPNPEMVAHDPLGARTNYFIGNDRAKWITGILNYEKIEYREVYPGIQLTFYGNDRQLEFDFTVSPGADPERIRLSFEGSKQIVLDPGGDLIVKTEAGDIRQHRPVAYQEIAGQKTIIAANYVITKENQVGFRVAGYDAESALIIDPILTYSSYLGGENLDRGEDIAVDTAGFVHVIGTTKSFQYFPLKNAFDSTPSAVFVAKFDMTKSGEPSLIYSTYLGGGLDDVGQGIAVDALGNTYVTGATSSSNFPLVNPFQAATSGRSAFIAKLNPNGNGLVYSTYLGGLSTDEGKGIAVDALGQAYVTGWTESSDFPLVNPYQNSLRGPADFFLSKLSASGNGLLYSTYLGGSDFDNATDVAVGCPGSAFVTGYTSSADFPVKAAADPIRVGNEAFIARFDTAGSGNASLVYATYLGGSDSDQGEAIAADSSCNAYATGHTSSRDFPITPGAYDPTPSGVDAYVVKLAASGSPIYSTYLGGAGDTGGDGIAVDEFGKAYVTGSTTARDFPTVGAIQKEHGDHLSPTAVPDAFVSVLHTSGSPLIYSTYLGGRGSDQGSAIAVDSRQNAYLTGVTVSTNFPIKNPYQAATGDRYDVGDAFVAKISPTVVCDIEMTKALYVNGDFVAARYFQISNPSSLAAPIELKVWLGVRGAPPRSVVNVGADGSVQVPPDSTNRVGPLPLFPVHSGIPSGDYEFSCRVLDPITGLLFSEDLNPFRVR